jgi:hypothetical protein
MLSNSPNNPVYSKDYPQHGLAQIADETNLGNLIPKYLFERYGTRALELPAISKRARMPRWLPTLGGLAAKWSS